MTIYLIEHPTDKSTGYFGGVDFYQGRGSTSSRKDAKMLSNLGYRVSELGTETVKHDTAAEGGAPAPSPVDFSPTPEELAATAKRDRDRAALDAAERNPDSPGQKELAAKLSDKAKRGRRRRKT